MIITYNKIVAECCGSMTQLKAKCIVAMRQKSTGRNQKYIFDAFWNHICETKYQCLKVQCNKLNICNVKPKATAPLPTHTNIVKRSRNEWMVTIKLKPNISSQQQWKRGKKKELIKCKIEECWLNQMWIITEGTSLLNILNRYSQINEERQ